MHRRTQCAIAILTVAAPAALGEFFKEFLSDALKDLLKDHAKELGYPIYALAAFATCYLLYNSYQETPSQETPSASPLLIDSADAFFKYMDTNGDGTVTRQEFRNVIDNPGQEVDQFVLDVFGPNLAAGLEDVFEEIAGGQLRFTDNDFLDYVLKKQAFKKQVFTADSASPTQQGKATPVFDEEPHVEKGKITLQNNSSNTIWAWCGAAYGISFSDINWQTLGPGQAVSWSRWDPRTIRIEYISEGETKRDQWTVRPGYRVNFNFV